MAQKENFLGFYPNLSHGSLCVFIVISKVTYECPNAPSSHSEQTAGRTRRGGRGGRKRRSRGGIYYSWVPSPDVPSLSSSDSHSSRIDPAPPPPGYSPPDPKWIFDNGCTAHSAYQRDDFTHMRECKEAMYAANGTSMTVSGFGTAGSIQNVLYLPDQANFYSQKQAMREGANISPSSDGLTIFTVTTPTGATMQF